MARPIGAQNKDKPFRDALRMEALALANGEMIDHPKGSLRWNAQRLLMHGDTPAIREAADRLDGKVPQALVGDDEHPPLTPYAEWLAWMKSQADIGHANNSGLTTNGHNGTAKLSLPGEAEKP